jgi:hypothetical protein
MENNDIEIIRNHVNSSASEIDIAYIVDKYIRGIRRIGNKYQWRREGSKNQIGAAITNVGLGFNYLKIFSDNISMPNKTNPTVWTYFDLLLHFQFNGDFKALMNYLVNGYNSNTSNKPQKQAPQTPKPEPIQTIKQPQKTALIGSSDRIDRFENEYFEDLSAIYEYDNNMTRSEADSRVIFENPTATYERLYRICVNEYYINKLPNEKYFSHSYFNKEREEVNIYKLFGKTYTKGQILTEFWQNRIVTISELIEIIQKGWSWLPSQMKSEPFEYRNQTYDFAYRIADNFIGSEIFCIDVDGGLTIQECLNLEFTQQRASFIYTSASHKPEHHKFRIVFFLPYFVTNAKHYNDFLERTILYYDKFDKLRKKGIDKATKEPHRVWYGSKDCEIYLVNGS